MKIDDLTIGEARELSKMFGGQVKDASSAFEIGSVYLIRTVTMIDTGRVVSVSEHEIVLEEAAWIADTGRFSDAVSKAKFDEVEPFPEGQVIIGRGAIIDATKIKKAPLSQK
ncbi:MAG: hypothetical protein KAV87_00080 [Desulfobacteraceae bacterium]|nr:hypothetical protein [Desulfobacteraceae bacterium]